ncbi:MAG: translocation/assembly module TamB domain-containing protein [Caulobacteraceae bacterium]|nr:translocation/assembly module TamB domain-containing protein [Caulobacteraceae bacterium]
MQAQWEERGRALTGSAQIEDAPIAPLAAIFGERATGRIDGRLSLASNGGGLSGDADVTLDDARVSGRQRNSLDMHIVGNLTPTRLTSTVDATSDGGLVAHFEADAPVETSAAPVRIALARERRGRATWSVHGPAEALWAAARLPDQSLKGALDGEGTVEFGAGYLSGDGHMEIVDGRFEDKLTGVTLVDLDARVALDQRGVTIENFTASGPNGGRLTATGGSVSDRRGSITVDVDNMRVADRPDARALASGELTLTWEGLTSSLTGNLNIIEANIDIASNPQAGIPTLDVIEINRPGEEDEPLDEEPAPRRNGATTLNVTVKAPGRVFTRGRGVDAEWALDMRLGGTSARPLVFGPRARSAAHWRFPDNPSKSKKQSSSSMAIRSTRASTSRPCATPRTSPRASASSAPRAILKSRSRPIRRCPKMKSCHRYCLAAPSKTFRRWKRRSWPRA